MALIPFILFIVQLILTYVLVQKTLNVLIALLRRVVKENSIVYSIVSIILLPGTIIHEVAHMFAAMTLMLKVYHINIFPKWEKQEIKLGTVLYGKTDIIRSFIVGIAPVIVGLIILILLNRFFPFSVNSVLINILNCYVIFIITLTMFSSKQDLQDALYLIPIIILIGLIAFFLRIKISLSIDFAKVLDFVNNNILFPLNYMLGIAMLLHGFFIIIVKSVLMRYTK